MIGTFKTAEEALVFLKDHKTDLIFLDIILEGMSGMDFIQQLTSVPHVIIISAKANFAAEAFNYDVVDFIVKPISFDRFLHALNKVKKFSESVSSAEKDFFFVKQQTKLVQIFFNDIIYIEALADYVNIHTAQKRFTILSTMKAMESQLPSNDFMRVHRSFIVRLDKIREIEENTIALDGKLIPVSRYSKEDLIKRINLI